MIKNEQKIEHYFIFQLPDQISHLVGIFNFFPDLAHIRHFPSKNIFDKWSKKSTERPKKMLYEPNKNRHRKKAPTATTHRNAPSVE